MRFIKSFFVPKSTLQGTEFPIHLLWDSDEEIVITIDYPKESIAITSVYNVKENGFSSKDGRIEFKSFEKNGYLGLSLKAKKLKEPKKKETIIINIKKGDEFFSEKIEILLFRPEVKIYPKEQLLIRELENNRCIIENKIDIKNLGLGTAFIGVESSDESDIEIYKPEEIEEYIKKFNFILKRELKELKEKFKEYENLINEFISILDQYSEKMVIKEDMVKRNKILVENLLKAFESNDHFFNKFAESFIIAYLESIHLFFDLYSFLQYLNSINRNRIILLNSMSILRITPGKKQRFIGKIHLTDLAYNEYKPINLNFVIEAKSKSSSEIKIPVFQLFRWV